MSEEKMMDLTNRYLRLEDGENPAVIIGAAFNVIQNVCNSIPEVREPTRSFMQRYMVMLENEPTVNH